MSGVWVGVDLRTDTKKASCVEKVIGLCLQKVVPILVSIVINIIGGIYMIILRERESSLGRWKIIRRTNGLHGHNWDLLIISH